MNQTAKQLWLEWLEDPYSRQYQRGLGYKDEEGRESFCCLGGLCAIAEENDVIERDDPDAVDRNIVYVYPVIGSDNEIYRGHAGGFLPPDVVKWADLASHDPSVTLTKDQFLALGRSGDEWERFGFDPEGELITLSELNDTLNFTLKEIAVLVREQL